MLHLKSHPNKTCLLVILCWNLMLLQSSSAELNTLSGAPISNLYDNLLQREYAGPVIFPNHQVERKAQRSPSLRLRFGRSDPDILNNIVEKRWFGDVNQKPIRSPSLRLRFGRRSDPNLPQLRRTAYDDLLERELTLNNQMQQQEQLDGGVDEADFNGDYDGVFERVLRKPQRLRWGRSVPQFETNRVDNAQHTRNQLLNSENMRRLLMAIQPYDNNGHVANDADGTETVDVQDENNSEFQREARKPMRLRWGRSTGGKVPAEQKQTTDETSSALPQTQN